MRNNNRGKDEKKVRSKKSKGFSLFTPLVGTAVIIIAILISITMIQNNLRISEGISDSYISSQQATGIQLIETASSVQIMENIRETVSGTLGGRGIGGWISATCSSKNDCISKTEDRFSSGEHGWYSLRTNMRHDAYDGIRDRLRRLGYSISMYRKCDEEVLDNPPYDTSNPQSCMDQGIAESEDIFNVEYIDGRLIVTSNLYKLRENPGKEPFHLNMTHIESDITISHPIIPDEITYTSPKIDDVIRATASGFDKQLSDVSDELEDGEVNDIDVDELCKEVRTNIRGKKDTGDFNLEIEVGENEKSSLKITWENIEYIDNIKIHYEDGTPTFPNMAECSS